MLLRVGTRGSRLALTQAGLAAERLSGSGFEIALIPITTAGDRDRAKPFGEIGTRGVFVKEIEEALLSGRIDVAVHSAKDMTSSATEGLSIGAFLRREDPRDALCGAAELGPGMRVGTASVRRRAQLLALEPQLVIEPLRGNIDTRLRKRRERGLDAIVLAACGLERLGLSSEIGYRFDLAELLPEAGQGSLALQVRVGDEKLVAATDDPETRRRVEAERACVAAVGGGCLAPVAAHHMRTAVGWSAAEVRTPRHSASSSLRSRLLEARLTRADHVAFSSHSRITRVRTSPIGSTRGGGSGAPCNKRRTVAACA
jgi:hydroxymethylbilane synthase